MRLAARPWQRDRTVLRITLQVIVYLCALNFVAFLVIGISIGGFADQGHDEGGRYFLHDHGKVTEVSQSVYEYSRLHGLSLWVTHPLAMLISLLMWRYPNPWARRP